MQIGIQGVPSQTLILLLVLSLGCARTTPGSLEWRQQTVEISTARVSLTLAKPASPVPPPFLVFFASGDGGLQGTSLAILRHLADDQYWAVGISSEEAFGDAMSETENYAIAIQTFASLIVEAKRVLGLPDQTPIILTGMSRGANVVIASAGDPTLKTGIVGAVAIALTREFDRLDLPAEKQWIPGVAMDDSGRIQTYPAIVRLGPTPLAIIQSTNDHYISAANSRRLLGPDTPTRRLYEVESEGHGFEGGYDALMRDLDDALKWIAEVAALEPRGEGAVGPRGRP